MSHPLDPKSKHPSEVISVRLGRADYLQLRNLALAEERAFGAQARRLIKERLHEIHHSNAHEREDDRS